jgi:predicted Zn-dependent protease
MNPVYKLLVTVGQALPLSLILLPTSVEVVLAETKTSTIAAEPSEVVVQTVEQPTALPEKLFRPTPSDIVVQTEPVVVEPPTEGTTAQTSPQTEVAQPEVTDPKPTPADTPSEEEVESTSPAQTSDRAAETETQTDERPQSESDEKPQTAETETETETENPENTEVEVKPAKSPEELKRHQTLVEADRLYLAGEHAAAERLYRQVKEPFKDATNEVQERVEPILDPEKLSPGGRVYWREAQAGLAQKQESRTFVAFNLLSEKHPEFLPGQILYAQALQEYGRSGEALTILERIATLYPNQPDLVRARVAALAKAEQWVEASIAARQYALLNPNDPAAAEFTTLADENLERYRKRLRRKLREQAIGNVITGAVGFALTGNLFGPLSAIQTTALLLRGESGVGERISKQVQRRAEMVEDRIVLDYVNELGQKLAKAAGRNDFQYEFHVILDDNLNAFALPGGKIFINAGAITKTNSEAELAGLLAHELSHAVLSHGFQLVTEGNLTANLAQFVPLGGLVSDLVVLDYSRDMERQADVLGTRILTSTGYAADGMRNLMVTLQKEDKDTPVFSWLSSHPGTKERVRYLEKLIIENGYNRYAFEGVERHTEVQARVEKLLIEWKKRRAERKKRRDRDSQQFLLVPGF